MKSLMQIMLLFVSITFFNSCQKKLDRTEAEKIIKSYYNFPIVEVDNYPIGYVNEFGTSEQKTANRELLIKNDLIYVNGTEWMDYKSYDLNENGKKFVYKYGYEIPGIATSKYYKVATNCKIFSGITGLALDESNKTAKVEFTCTSVGITPFGEVLKHKTGKIYNYSLDLVLYDDGWRISNTNNKEEIINISIFSSIFDANGEYVNHNLLTTTDTTIANVKKGKITEISGGQHSFSFTLETNENGLTKYNFTTTSNTKFISNDVKYKSEFDLTVGCRVKVYYSNLSGEGTEAEKIEFISEFATEDEYSD